ncbi:hypothetical protein BP5796_06425 [Coleophoma crateriformis]|uniref:Uncharacterized protein n=1 Tax=Coleophoma crateriformis TaxID=565419 RepID=A0A3D8RNY2_9HELO|nr:hypothetical protein BP5796_06425 [Coleophoma crateriformis]
MVDRISSGQYIPVQHTTQPVSAVNSPTASYEQAPKKPAIAVTSTLVPVSPEHCNTTEAYVFMTSNMLTAYADMRGELRDHGGPLWKAECLRIVQDPNWNPAAPHLFPDEWYWTLPSHFRRSSNEFGENGDRIPQGTMMVYTHASMRSKPQQFEGQDWRTGAESRDFARRANSIDCCKFQSYDQARKALTCKQYRHRWQYKRQSSWIDPDASSGDGRLDELGHIPPSALHLLANEAPGPRILSEEEEDENFQYMVDYLSDDEGDPRDPTRTDIDPYSFLCWATGAVRGSRYVEEDTEMLPQSPQRFKRIRGTPSPKKLERPRLQWDLETGTPLSGSYEVDSNPSPLWSPQGINMSLRPSTFSRSQPLVNIGLERAAFGHTQRRHSSLAEGARTIRLVSSEAAIEALATGKDKASGAVLWESYKQRMAQLQEEFFPAYEEYKRVTATLDEVFAKRKDLSRSVAFLRERVKKREQEKADLEAALEAIYRESKRYEYLQMLEEQEETVIHDTNRIHETNEIMKEEIMRAAAEIESLENERAVLLEKLQVD